MELFSLCLVLMPRKSVATQSVTKKKAFACKTFRKTGTENYYNWKRMDSHQC